MNFFNKFNRLHNNYKDKKFIMLSLFLGMFGIFFVTVGSSYAYITYQGTGNETNVITAGTLSVSFDSESSAIMLDKALPQTVNDAINNNPSHDFRVSNNGNYDLNYKLSLISTCKVGEFIDIDGVDVKIDKCIPMEYIKVGVRLSNGDYIIKDVNSDGTITLGDFSLLTKKSASDFYSVKIWLSLDTPSEYSGVDSNGNYINSIFTGKIEIYGEQVLDDAVTDDSCFEVIDGIITDYKCYMNNNYNLNYVSYVLIPDEIDGVVINEIAEKAFYDKDLVSVTIPSTIKKIGAIAFENNDLIKVTYNDRTSVDDVELDDTSFDDISVFRFNK